MKAGDKVLYSNDVCDYVYIEPLTIEKISKDKKKVRDEKGEIHCLSRLSDTKDSFIYSLVYSLKRIDWETKFVLCRRIKGNSQFFLYKASVCEDEFDDIYHISSGNKSWTVSKVKDSMLLENTSDIFDFHYFETIESAANFIIQQTKIFQQESLLEKYNKWQEKFGYDKTDEFWTDYLGGTTQLEWAIDNDIDCLDYDRWQLVQKLLKHELKYETANDIFNTLYEKEDIEIFDCE